MRERFRGWEVAGATWCREFVGVGSSSPCVISRFWIPWGRELQELELVGSFSSVVPSDAGAFPWLGSGRGYLVQGVRRRRVFITVCDLEVLDPLGQGTAGAGAGRQLFPRRPVFRHVSRVCGGVGGVGGGGGGGDKGTCCPGSGISLSAFVTMCVTHQRRGGGTTW